MRISSRILVARVIGLFLMPFFIVSAAWAESPTFKVLHEFASGPTDGGYPYSPLLYRSGNLIGITDEGGLMGYCYSYGCGVAFEVSQRNGHWMESVFYDFSPAPDGVAPSPAGPLAVDSQGNVYGTQASGGDPSCGCGFVYQLTKSAGVWTQSTLHNFVGGTTDGEWSNSGLIVDGKGNLYGVTQSGGASNYGTVFELSPTSDGSWTYNLIYEFGSIGYLDGEVPFGRLAIDSHGNLYGTTQFGGTYGSGTAFKLSPSGGSWEETILYNFTEDYGGYPTPSGVVMDAGGNLYGTTNFDGIYALGTVYKLTPAVGFWSHSLLHTFSGGADGAYPYEGLAVDTSGALYGTAHYGGSYGFGVVFKLQSSSGKWSESELHTFENTTDGTYPSAGVALDPSGNIYGTAESGGTYGFGTAFEITQ